MVVKSQMRIYNFDPYCEAEAKQDSSSEVCFIEQEICDESCQRAFAEEVAKPGYKSYPQEWQRFRSINLVNTQLSQQKNEKVAFTI